MNWMLELLYLLFQMIIRRFKSIRTVKLAGHNHLVLSSEFNAKNSVIGSYYSCYLCDVSDALYHYYCNDCDKAWHNRCMPSSSEINHPCHPNHALKLLLHGAPSYSDGNCNLCQAKLGDYVYHCSTCNFSLDVSCGKYPQRIRVKRSKCHSHPLTLVVKKVSFMCNACGMDGKSNPYVCLACSFMVHEGCIDLPHVINVNRHDHRISHTYFPGQGSWTCVVCREIIDWMYGAYSCARCPGFYVHSTCATKNYVWNGEELEGVPEEEEDKPMFKVIEENVIYYKKHSHYLRFTEDGALPHGNVRCRLCARPVYSERFYGCMEYCDYFLHEACLYLPQRKRHGLFNNRIILSGRKYSNFQCMACHQSSSGYRYKGKHSRGKLDIDLDLDLRCASIDWYCDHESHSHTLFLTDLQAKTCSACNCKHYVLRCTECKFNFCYKCASYPRKIMHRCDDHPLMLSFGDKEQPGTYWCTVCERKLDPKKWFYECEECGIVCHIKRVLGDFANIQPGYRTTYYGITGAVFRNKGVTRPHCHSCRTRCLVPFIYRKSGKSYCSNACLQLLY